MDEQNQDIDPHFVQLVISLQAGAMQQMGKITSPMTGKVERNLEIARLTIDTLSMLEAKTKGNLTSEESKLIGHILYELRLNYVDEVKKEEAGTAAADKETKEEQSAKSGQASGEGSPNAAQEEDSGGSPKGE